jgi:UDP-glucose 4-epimerase
MHVLPEDLAGLNSNAPLIVEKRAPGFQQIYDQFGWEMFDKIDRVYVNDTARRDLGWQPKYDFAYILKCLKNGSYPRSAISELVGSKGYHEQMFEEGPYPVHSQ